MYRERYQTHVAQRIHFRSVRKILASLGSFLLILFCAAATAQPPMGPLGGPPLFIPGPVSSPVTPGMYGMKPIGMQVSNDPMFGPLCEGPVGPAMCESVHRYIGLQQRAVMIQMAPPIGFHPQAGPICAGPLGPGPCYDVAMWIAMAGEAEATIPLPILEFTPMGPVCAGPLGPGPCTQVKVFILQQSLNLAPQVPPNLQQLNVVGSINTPFGRSPACLGPMGPMPCALLPQMGLDAWSGPIPGQGQFGLSAAVLSDPLRLARECARQVGADVTRFAGCAGQKVILPKREQAILDCAVSNRTALDFGKCAASSFGLTLAEDQRKAVQCAISAKGNAESFTDCMGLAIPAIQLSPEQRAIVQCGASTNSAESFASCAAPSFMGQSEQAALRCAVESKDAATFVSCAADQLPIKVSEDQRIVAKCAMQSKGDTNGFFTCAGSAFAGKNLSSDQKAVLQCASNSGGDTSAFANCAAGDLLTKNLSREQQIAVRCAAESGGDPTATAVCAGTNLMALNLNPEQQIAVQCVAATGGEPYSAAGCMASRLTMRELTKCFNDGIGGSGCFGDSNDLVGRNGWVGRTFGQITGGSNSVINNPDQIWGGDNSFVRNPGQVWGGPNSVFNKPSQVFGGPNSFFNNPQQVFGGPNSVFNNPGQILPKPRPMVLGKVGGKRVCLPWC